VHTFVLASLFSAAHFAEGVFGRTWLIHQANGWTILDLGSRLADDGLTLVFLAAVVALSALTYRFVERPGQRLAARLAAAKSPTLAPQIA
jgi:peptidoglycan/LPS O-acetylase OafA/YrhL